jgi:hypothetical protein
MDLPSDEDEMAAANAAMMAKPRYSNKGPKMYSNANRGGDYEERKTTVINVSKNIYKPSFNMPAKDNYSEPTPKKKETGGKSVKKEDRPASQSRKQSASRNPKLEKPLKRDESQPKVD